jgi:hypothetical protein
LIANRSASEAQLSVVEELGALGDNDRLEAAVNAQRSKKVGDVVPHGRLAQAQLIGDLVRGPAFSQQAQNLELALGERRWLADSLPWSDFHTTTLPRKPGRVLTQMGLASRSAFVVDAS